MSEPMRFSLKHHGQLSCVEHCPEGEYVLHSDYAKLKAEVESLKKPATIGGYNISEYIRMANSETLEFDNGDIFADMTLPERIKYIVESHARLKAEVERLRASSFVTAVPVEQYERLRKAGDAMADELIQEYGREVCLKFGWFKGWNAAKEGKPSV